MTQELIYIDEMTDAEVKNLLITEEETTEEIEVSIKCFQAGYRCLTKGSTYGKTYHKDNKINKTLKAFFTETLKEFKYKFVKVIDTDLYYAGKSRGWETFYTVEVKTIS